MNSQRIVVIGTTGSGKTTLAGQIAERLVLPHAELDALYWEPNWTPAPREVFRARVAQAVSSDAWVADGNYSSARDLVWSRAVTIIWLDYPLPLILWRLLKRGIRRSITRAELWNGNRETFRTLFLSRDTLFLWALKTHFRRRRETPAVLASVGYAHLALVHLRSPRETRAWLSKVAAGGTAHKGTPANRND